MDGACSVAVSADGLHVYVLAGDDKAVTWFDRNVSTGALTYGGALKESSGGVDGLSYAEKLTLSADDLHVYVAHDAGADQIEAS